MAVVSRLTDFGLEHTDDFYFPYRYIVLHGFHTIPIICILLVHGGLILTLKKKQRHDKDNTLQMCNATKVYADSMNTKMILMVQRIVFFLVVCYVPFLAWKHYFYSVISKRSPLRILIAEVIPNNT